MPAGLPRFKAGDRPAGIGDWELVELLGVGGFGEVWKATTRVSTAAPVALNTASIQKLGRPSDPRGRILNQVMRQGKLEGIVPLLHTYLSADPPCLAYEYIDGGDLAGLIQASRAASHPQAARVVQPGGNRGLRPSPESTGRPPRPQTRQHPDEKGCRASSLRITDFGIGGLAIQQAVRSRGVEDEWPIPDGGLAAGIHALGRFPAADARWRQTRPADNVYAWASSGIRC